MKKTMLVDLIISYGFKSLQHAREMTKAGLANFYGDEWGEEWNWNRAELLKLDLEQLKAVYAGSMGEPIDDDEWYQNM